METTVISLGGSIIVPGKIDDGFVKTFREFVLKREGRFAIIVGGGMVAREYQAALKELGGKDEDLDWIGIQATRMNAELVRLAFGDDAYERIITDPTEGIQTRKKIIIGAGWKPGRSTDYCAVTLAETLGARTAINLSNIRCVYDKDPKAFPDARPIKACGWKEMRAIVGDEWSPGLNAPFDPIAAKKAQKLGLRVAIMDGKDLDNLGRFLDGKEFEGTLVSDE